MPTLNKKAVRTAAGEFTKLPDEQLIERFTQPMTESEHAALLRVMRQRQITPPAEHGTVSDDPEVVNTRVITLEELSQTGADFGLEKRKPGMGWPEWCAVIVGMGTTIMLWQKSFAASVLYGLGSALIVYSILVFGRKFWRELGSRNGKIEGKQKEL